MKQFILNLNRWIIPFKGRSLCFLSLVAHGYFLKAGNYLLTLVNMIRQPDCASNYPALLVIEPGNICNLSCALCITGQKKSHRLPKLLKFSEFKKIIDRLGKTAVHLDLYNFGEPLLNKEIFKMIAYAKKFGLRIDTSSNLLLLTPEIAEKLVSSHLDRLIVSLHGGSPETTKIYMRNGDFDKAVANLKTLIETKKKLKSSTPSIIWRFVVSRYNESELEKTKEFAYQIGVDYFQPVPIKLWVGFDPDVVVKNFKNSVGWVPKNEKYQCYDLKNGKMLKNSGNCFWPWEAMTINADGGIQPCCMFDNPTFDFGNIFITPFEKIWNGEKYRMARKIVRNKIKTDNNNLCGRCVAHGFVGK